MSKEREFDVYVVQDYRSNWVCMDCPIIKELPEFRDGHHYSLRSAIAMQCHLKLHQQRWHSICEEGHIDVIEAADRVWELFDQLEREAIEKCLQKQKG